MNAKQSYVAGVISLAIACLCTPYCLAQAPGATAIANNVSNASITQLTAQLRDPTVTARFAAVMELGRRADKSVIPSLKPLLSDPDEGVRVQAAHSLALLGNESGLPVLRETLKSKDEFWALFAAMYLAQNGDASGRPIIESKLKSPNWARRCDALTALDFLPGGASYAAIAAGIADPNEYVRRTASRIAGRKTTADVQSLIRSYLEASDPEDRVLAIGALYRSNRRATLAETIVKLTDPNRGVRLAALMALGSTTGRKVTPMSVSTPAAAATTRAEWAQWWSENKDKPLPAQPAAAPGSSEQKK